MHSRKKVSSVGKRCELYPCDNYIRGDWGSMAKAKLTSPLHPGELFFSKEKELPWVGFELTTTLCSLGEHSTN